MLARLPRATTLLVVAFVLALAAVATGMHATASQAAADEERAARNELARDLGELRRDLTAPAHTARSATAALRLNLAELVAGSDRDLDAVVADRQRLVDDLRSAADDLDANSEVTVPEAADALPAETVQRIDSRLDGLDEQARWVAAHLRATADEVSTWAGVVEELRTSADALLALEAPDTQEPDDLAARWNDELEALGTYREAAEEAAGRDDLDTLGEAHLELIDGLEDLAAEAVERLEDGDVDGYNALLEQRLSDEDPFGFTEALETAVAESLGTGPIEAVEEAQARTLGLLAELEQLRRATPARSGA